MLLTDPDAPMTVLRPAAQVPLFVSGSPLLEEVFAERADFAQHYAVLVDNEAEVRAYYETLRDSFEALAADPEFGRLSVAEFLAPETVKRWVRVLDDDWRSGWPLSNYGTDLYNFLLQDAFPRIEFPVQVIHPDDEWTAPPEARVRIMMLDGHNDVLRVIRERRLSLGLPGAAAHYTLYIAP